MSVMTVRVVTPDKLVFDGEAERIFARGIDGDFAVLYNHIPMMTPLGVGELRIDMNGKVHILQLIMVFSRFLITMLMFYQMMQ